MKKALNQKIMRTITDKYVWPNRKYFKLPFADLDEKLIKKNSKDETTTTTATATTTTTTSATNPNNRPSAEAASSPMVLSHSADFSRSPSRDVSPQARKPPPPSPSSPQYAPPLPPRNNSRPEQRLTTQLEPMTRTPPGTPPKPDRRHSYHDGVLPPLPTEVEKTNRPIRSSTIPQKDFTTSIKTEKSASSNDLASSESVSVGPTPVKVGHSGPESLNYIDGSLAASVSETSAQVPSLLYIFLPVAVFI